MNLPQFSAIKPDQIEADVTRLLTTNEQKIAALLHQKDYTWHTLMLPLEEIHDELHRYWSLVSHLHSVADNEALRAAYNACLPRLSEYSTKIAHNRQLYDAIESLQNTAEYKDYDEAQKRVIENALRDFRLAGVHLDGEQKKQYSEIVLRLSQLTSQFEQNILDATQAWQKHVTNESELSGIPQHAIEMAAQTAAKKGKTGFVFTLEFPSYLPVLEYADSRHLRHEMYHAFVTRASETGPTAGKWDNSQIMYDILALRMQLAKLLKFEHYAHHSLATKMAPQPTAVLDFLNQLVEASLPAAKQEFKILQAFAETELDIEKLEAWDVAYVSEKLRQNKYAVSQEQLRPYFPEPAVLQGLFAVVGELFDLQIKPVEQADTWHKDVKCFAILDAEANVRSYFYMDLYARSHKRGGAWMDDCQGRRELKNGEFQIPIAFVTCNFSAPVGNDPALFTHDDVVTLFHEFGHALQHMLTKVNYADVAGINGIPWDAVEVASQFLENYAWEQTALAKIARHYQTHEPLPEALFLKMQQARHFQAAMQMVRQLEFSLFDFMLHIEFNPEQEQQVQKILKRVRGKVAVVPTPEFNRFEHSFSHIFAGGYAAGYYSYKWAEVMAADAFDLFLQVGIFNRDIAKKYLQHILEPGGSRDFAQMFRDFRGRDPKVEALLKQSGIV